MPGRKSAGKGKPVKARRAVKARAPARRPKPSARRAPKRHAGRTRRPAKARARRRPQARKARAQPGPLKPAEVVNIEELGFHALARFDDEREVLRVALLNEVTGRNLYLQYAQTLTNEMARRVFSYLAEEELRHIEDIKEYMRAMSLGASVNVESMIGQNSVGGTKLFFGKLTDEFVSGMAPSDDDNKCRDIAMRVEKAGYEYYEKGAEMTKDIRLRRFFGWLMEQEQAHYMLIRNAFEFSNDPTSWYEQQERWLLEG